MLDCVDQLDIASYALTRVEAFSKREAPSAEEIECWLANHNPFWRVGSTDCARLEALAGRGTENGSYALTALRSASEELLRSTASGWKLIGSPGATSILRWRLPLGTVHAAAAAAAGLDSPGGQPRPAAHDEFLAQLQDLGAVDGHVHVGTCMPFDGLFELLMDHTARAPTDEPTARGSNSPPPFSDSSDKSFDPSTLLIFATSLNLVLGQFLTSEETDFDAFVSSSGIDEPFGQALLDGSGWEFVQKGDRQSLLRGSRIESPASLLGRVAAAERPELADPFETAIQRKFDLLRKQFRETPGAAYAGCVEDLLRCEALLHIALAQGNRAGLSEFLIRSKRLSRLRKSVPDRTRAVIRHGLPHLSHGMWLKGVELRTAEQNDEHKGAADLAKSLDAQLAGYQEAMHVMDGAKRPMATWPICLIKDPAMVADPEKTSSVAGAAPRFDLNNLFNLVDITADLLTKFPAARKLISGLDVAGDENAVPSWCFALLFSEFMERLGAALAPADEAGRMAFRVHAGEEFDSPLQGLRRIDEAVRFVIPDEHLPRIGHGLALSHSAGHFSADALSRQPSDEAFDDLVWTWLRLKSSNTSGTADLVKAFEEAIVSKGSKLYGECGASGPEDYGTAYEMRFNVNALRSVGFLAPSSFQARLTPSRSLRQPTGASPAERILFKYLTQNKLRAPCEIPLIDPVWLTQAIDTVRPLVRRAVIEYGAVIEVCPTSNVLIGGLDGYGRHPVHDWIPDDIDVTVNTDDPGLFSITLVDEYGYLWSSEDGTPKERLEKFRAIQNLSSRMMGTCRDVDETERLVEQVRSEWREAGMSCEGRALPRRAPLRGDDNTIKMPRWFQRLLDPGRGSRRS